EIIAQMLPLLNDDRAEATDLFDQVILNCPEVLQNAWALYFLSRAVGWFEPKEIVQGWLDILHKNDSSFSQQAYGEMLLVQYLQYQDAWSVQQIRHHLTNDDNEAILAGLAYAASHLWVHSKCRAIASEILYTLASSSYESVQRAVANVFFLSRDRFRLNSGMRKVITAVCDNQSVLRLAVESLAEIAESENWVEDKPKIVVQICTSLLENETDINGSSYSAIMIAESLTTIAIQLHRQEAFREIGLHIFEKLLALNLRETRDALETLDRRPSKINPCIRPRRRRRRKLHA
ncbi:MAG: ATP-binding protein, partial [Cyanothece sp. SIO2G6]|nr:ATP-binding protein [Cyanothece sp. SIO2G6]